MPEWTTKPSNKDTVTVSLLWDAWVTRFNLICYWIHHSYLDVGSLPEIEHTLRLCVRVLHWELQTTRRRSRRSHEVSRRKTPWTMSTWVKLLTTSSLSIPHIVIEISWTSMVFDWMSLAKLNYYLNQCKERYGKQRIWHGIIIGKSVYYDCRSAFS